MQILLIVGAECAPLELGQRDVERHISEHGNCQAQDAANFLNDLGVSPHIILTGPFIRTKETGQCLSQKLNSGCKVETVSELMPGAGPGELMQSITQRSADCSEKGWIAVVIHSPDANYIFRSILGENYSLPICPGMVVGMEISCNHANISGKILFSRYPGAI